MVDAWVLRQLRPVLGALAGVCAAAGLTASQVTAIGLGLGLASAACVVQGQFAAALLLLLANRLADGVDGMLARMQAHLHGAAAGPSARGAFFDSVADFVFYAAFPLAFAWHQPAANALPAATLLAAFVGTGASFLAFAAVAAQQGLANPRLPDKGFYYLGGLTEGTETVLCFGLMCLWPQHFAVLAYGFAALCGVTLATRVVGGWRLLR
jgi:phosphatidylglycerophosphate synthase